MLKKTPRTGYQFLGTGKESVAEHSFRTAIIGYVLASIVRGVNLLKVVVKISGVIKSIEVSMRSILYL